MIFETHAHYDGEEFDSDRVELLLALQKEGVDKIINVGASIEGSIRSVELAEQYPFIYASVGVHPDDVATMTEDDIETLRKLSANEKVIAIGEIVAK